jgi:cysteine desulfurase
MNLPIYLDYAASTPVDPTAAEKMMNCLTMDGIFANPASRSHVYGWQAEEAVETARKALAQLINCDTREIVWTSGATESNNLALKGIADSNKHLGKHIISSRIEHKAVLDTLAFLETQGFDVTYLTPNSSGEISVDHVKAALTADTIIVSLMQVNNEIGTISNVKAIAELLKDHQALLHVDGAQSVGKLVVDVKDSGIDLMSMSAHKMYGPKGMGALYVRRSNDVKVNIQMHGGGHERGMRSGTLATHQIVGMGSAAAVANAELASEINRLTELKNHLWTGLQQITGVVRHGEGCEGVAGILNVGFPKVDGETLLIALREIAVSTGSACTSASVEPSYVLKAIGVETELAHSSIRFSLGRFTTKEEIDYAIDHVVTTVNQLQNL